MNPPSAIQMSAESIKTSVLEAYQGFQRGDLNPLMWILSDNLEWINYEDSPLGGTYHGKEEVADYIQRSFKLTKLLRYELESLMSERNKTIGVVNVSYEVLATGKTHSGTDIHLMDFKEQKIVRFREIGLSAAKAWS